MTKANRETKRIIIEMVAKTNPKIKDICRKAGISDQTLRNWLEADPAFSEEYKAARRAYLDTLRAAAERSLAKLVKGYEWEQERTVYVPGKGGPVIAQKVITKMHVPPNEKAIEFVLKNTDPQNFE